MRVPEDYFRLLGVPARFDLDTAELKRNARALQREYHPDRFASRTPQEQRMAAQLSAQVNSALATLQDPVRRAHYLLEHRGISTNAATHTERDTEFLMQQMTLREQLESARMAGDARELDQLAESTRASYQQEQASFSSELAANAGDDELVARVSRMRFYQKLIEETQSARAALAAQ